jgi:hypothetical protein
MRWLKWLVGIALLSGVVMLWLKVERLPQTLHGIPNVRPEQAAEQLLARHSVTSRRITSSAQLFPLPSIDTLLIVDRSHGRLPAWQQEQLLDWVQRGGQLLTNVLPHLHDDYQDGLLEADSLARHDPLLYALGVTAWRHTNIARRSALPDHSRTAVLMLEQHYRRHCINRPASEKNLCTRLTCGSDAEPSPYTLLNSQAGLLQLDLDPQIDLLHRDLYSTPPENNPTTPPTEGYVDARGYSGNQDTLLEVSIGRGAIWAMADLLIFTNERLHHLDHAGFLLHLVSQGGQVWWVQQSDSPSLYLWLWQRAWPLIIASLMLLILFLAYHIPRRGIMLRPQAHQQRDFTAHLHAAAALQWRLRETDALLGPLRRECLRALTRHGEKYQSDSQVQLAAQRSTLTEQEIHDALHVTPQTDEQLQQVITLLQKLRQQLSAR